MFWLQQFAESVLPPGLVQIVGWLLVNSLWQFALIALAVMAVSRVLHRQTASLRYCVLAFAMLLMLLSPIATWFVLPIQPEAIAFRTSTSPAAYDGEPDQDQKLFSEVNALVGPSGPPGELPAMEANNIPIDADSIYQDHNIDGSVLPHQVDSKSILSRMRTPLTAAVGPWLTAMVSVWCLGVLLFSMRLIWSWWTVRRLRRYGTQPVADFVSQSLQRMCTKLQVVRPVEVLASSIVTSPVVVGCFRSVILLPANFISSVPVSQLEAILAHELAHVRRYDYLVNLLQTLIETLFFYHPAVWWLSNRIRVERENCCDDWVVRALDNRVEYGRALLAVEQLRGQIGSSLALRATDGRLLARVRRLLADPGQSDPPSRGVAAGLGVLLVGLAVILMWHSTLVLGQSEFVQSELVQSELEQSVERSEATSEEGEAASQPDADVSQSLRRIYGKVVDEAGGAVSGASSYAKSFDRIAMIDATDNLDTKRVTVVRDSRPLSDRVVEAFDNKMPLADRLASLKRESARDSTRIAVVVAQPESKQAEWFYRLLQGTNEDRRSLNIPYDLVHSLRMVMKGFRLLWVDDAQLDELRALIPGHQLQDHHSSVLILLDTDGAWLSLVKPDLEANPENAPQELLTALNANQLEKLDAAVILAHAKTQAAQEGKRILLQETATECEKCHRLSRFIEQHREILDRHFVWIKIERNRMRNADEILDGIRSSSSRGLPRMAILSAEGDCLVNSGAETDDLRSTLDYMIRRLNTSPRAFGPKREQVIALVQRLTERRQELYSVSFTAENYIFPSEPAEVEHFLTMLKTSAEALSDNDIATLRNSLLGKVP